MARTNVVFLSAVLAAGCTQTITGGAGGDAATSADGPAGAIDARASGDGATATDTELAPYFYTWGWGSDAYAFPSLVQMKARGGPDAITIAFVLSGGGCTASREVQDNLDDVRAYIAAGGHVKASFGGAAGTYLESACGDADALAAAISAWVTETGITDLDFDIEQGDATSNPAINTRRANALKQVQQAHGIRVAFTLPVNPDGLDDRGKAVVQSALDAGVEVSFVNVMTMDYGAGTTDLGQVAIGSSDATAHQVAAMMNIPLADAYRKVGATPMIGRNDDGTTFSQDDARALASWAQAHRLGLLAFWAIQRDEACPGGVDLDVCSGANAGTFDFANIFGAAVGS